MSKCSAGILLFRYDQERYQVLLGHMGGPYWSKKDEGAWVIPKGEYDPAIESPLDAAKREFEEETGFVPVGPYHDLGELKQKGGKMIAIWAVEEDLDPNTFRSNHFEMEWPPRSGQMKSFPELDRVKWFSIPEARQSILKSQEPMLERLRHYLSDAHTL